MYDKFGSLKLQYNELQKQCADITQKYNELKMTIEFQDEQLEKFDQEIKKCSKNSLHHKKLAGHRNKIHKNNKMLIKKCEHLMYVIHSKKIKQIKINDMLYDFF